MYECHLCEPEDVADFITIINSERAEIVSVIYLGDSRQVLFIYEITPKPKLSIFSKEEEEE